MNKILWVLPFLFLMSCQPAGKPVMDTGNTAINSTPQGNGNVGSTGPDSGGTVNQLSVIQRKLPQGSKALKIPQGYVTLGCSTPSLYNFCFSVIDHDGEKIGEYGDSPKITLSGANAYNLATAIAFLPPNDVVIIGNTTGNLAEAQGGNGDGFVARYSLNGSRIWMKQWGAITSGVAASEREDFLDVAVDGSNNIWIAGRTRGNLFGVNAGNFDAIFFKLNSSGSVTYSKQIIGAGAINNDEYKNISITNGGQVLLSGTTCGSLFEMNAAPTTDAGYLASAPCPTEKFSDIIASLYSLTGSLLFNRQLGKVSLQTGKGAHSESVLDHHSNVAGEIFLTGGTFSQLSLSSNSTQNNELNGGLMDIYVAKLSSSGALLWVDQMGSLMSRSNKIDMGEKVFFDEDTLSVLVCATTTGDLVESQGGGAIGLAAGFGKGDLVLLKYSNAGSLVESKQLGLSKGSRTIGRELCGSMIRDNDTIALFGISDGALFSEVGSSFFARKPITQFIELLD